MEVFFQVALQIILLFFTDTSTPTTSGLQTFFQQNTLLGLDPSIILGLSIAWSLRTSIKLHVKSIKTQKVLFRNTSVIFVGLWGLVASLRRILSVIGYFTPSLGLFSLLSHWLAEQYTFSIRQDYSLIYKKDEIHLFNASGTLYWSELDRWNYYGSPDDPTPPSYSLYTGLTLKWTFVTFFMLMAFQFLSISLVKIFTSKEFKEDRDIFNKCLHILQNLNFPFVYVDWDEKMVTRDEFQTRYKNTEQEMKWSFIVSSLFSIIMLLPIWFTGRMQDLIYMK